MHRNNNIDYFLRMFILNDSQLFVTKCITTSKTNATIAQYSKKWRIETKQIKRTEGLQFTEKIQTDGDVEISINAFLVVSFEFNGEKEQSNLERDTDYWRSNPEMALGLTVRWGLHALCQVDTVDASNFFNHWKKQRDGE